MNHLIETRNLSKWYGNVLGLSDVSLKIEPGITGILGPNGAGKSTFMKLITGQIKPKIGSALVDGSDVRNTASLFANIGFCPEQDTFYEEMTGRQFLESMLSLHFYSREEVGVRTQQTLELVDLKEDQDRVVRSYSRGMRQRLKIAQAIAHDPEIIILDEPLNGLDPLGRRKVIRLIKEYGGQGRTVIVSSHVLPEIEAMTKDIILIHQGKIFAQGDIHYIRDLIDTHPHQVSIKCSSPRSLAAEMVEESYILHIHFNPKGDGLVFETNNRDAFFSRLPSIVVEKAIRVDQITSPDDNLQAVFDYLIGK